MSFLPFFYVLYNIALYIPCTRVHDYKLLCHFSSFFQKFAMQIVKNSIKNEQLCLGWKINL